MGNETKEEIGRLVRVAREQLGWSQHELSRRTGVDRGQITRIEAGSETGSVATLVKLASALAIDLNALKDPDLTPTLTDSNTPI